MVSRMGRSGDVEIDACLLRFPVPLVKSMRRSVLVQTVFQ